MLIGNACPLCGVQPRYGETDHLKECPLKSPRAARDERTAFAQDFMVERAKGGRMPTTPSGFVGLIAAATEAWDKRK